MSATATLASTKKKLDTHVDQEWVCGAVSRWKVAAEYVFFLDPELLPTGHPLRRFVRQDFPDLLQELLRLRPELR
jgi:hypothetical protein